MQLLGRGALAGVTGEVIGVFLSSLLWPPNAYWYVGYVYWLLINIVLGLTFTLASWGVQKILSRLDVLGRAAVGGVIGAVTAWVWTNWVSAASGYHDTPNSDFGKSIMVMIVTTGAVSGILAVLPGGEQEKTSG